ncbi:DNA-processing protein DprA [Actinoplanes sp. NPDC026619]|uniref:DNA-processing protein DprA n=1 Tax=Actinoplanes sp. NPDC026619 TaxID=3155798 RepID=UPI0033C1B730
MTVDDDPVRDVLAALSYYLGKHLPEHLADLTMLHHYRPGEAPGSYRMRVLKAGDGARAAALLALGRSLRERADDAGIALLIRGDTGWPGHADLGRVPCLWVRGNPDLHTALIRSVTVTGSRAASDEGRMLAAEIGLGLADAGLTVVTGLSAGIDAAAAAAAFDSTTPPVLVHPGGLDQPAGLTLRNLADRAASMSALISPFPPGCDRTSRRWDYRNLLLGMLSAVTVVIEASSTPRGILTARAATESGRLVCAVPGPVRSGLWSGCHQLIADGVAQLVTGPSAVLDALQGAAQRGNPAAVAAFSGLDTEANPGMQNAPAEPTP